MNILFNLLRLLSLFLCPLNLLSLLLLCQNSQVRR